MEVSVAICDQKIKSVPWRWMVKVGPPEGLVGMIQIFLPVELAAVGRVMVLPSVVRKAVMVVPFGMVKVPE